MREIEPPFEIDYTGLRLSVTEHEISDERVFHISFGGVKKDLTIAVGLSGGKKVWMSIPQGRQLEAEQIGKLIANYIRNKRKE
ncbi:hypothetical protein AB6735_03990 [Mucilaginibacter sp. RCC_168]|uniref:hypothetical protein n=1 Tax=Mucilaginibacter sp. RCC_168 TaxID=3239221 RepID=UPI003523BCBC